jgi:hypothetical protein
MNLKSKLLLNIIASATISYILLILTFTHIEKINTKITFKGVVKLRDYPTSSNLINITALKNKISIYFYEAREEMIYDANKNYRCDKLRKPLALNVSQNKAGYFIIELMSVKNEKILFQCFEDYLSLINKKFNFQIEKLEDELAYKSTKPEVIEEFFNRNENLPNLNTKNEEAELFLYQQKTTFLLKEILNNLEYNNYLNILKNEGPIDVLRTNLQKQTLDKKNYFILLFIGFFSIFFLIYNYKNLPISKKIKKIIKILDI